LSLVPVMAKLPATARVLAIITARLLLVRRSGRSGKDASNSIDSSQAWTPTKKRNLQGHKAGTTAILDMPALTRMLAT